jgi:hypothetical protein
MQSKVIKRPLDDHPEAIQRPSKVMRDAIKGHQEVIG